MSRAARISLAIAVAWAGGLGSFEGPGWARLLAGLAVLLACAWLRPHVRPAGPDERLQATVRVAALALVLGLLARTLGRVVIAVPAVLWAVPIVAVGLLLRRGEGWRRAAPALVIVLALAAALAGSRFEAHAPQPRGRALSGPIIGVHPRQAASVRIDGFGPHDLVVDDYVDPGEGLGYDAVGFAAWLELELHEIARTHYADGPARARVAFENAEVRVVDAVVAPEDADHYVATIGIEVRSGTSGEGSKVEFVCPGRTLGVRDSPEPSRACPRKYVVDGSTGLGLSSRFPGYAEVRGRDRARLAFWLGWPHGDARADRRSLALESGAILLMLVIGGWLLARRQRLGEGDASGVALAGSAALVLAGIAVLGSDAPLDAASWGPTLLAVAVLALSPAAPEPSTARDLGWPLAALVALLAASPLAGHGDAIVLLETTVERLVLGLGLDWSTSSALAGGLAVVALSSGVAASAGALFDLREHRRGRASEAIRLAVALAIAVALALRKPTDDLALLTAGCALLLASTLQFAQQKLPAPRLS